jgi:hypothetical protein
MLFPGISFDLSLTPFWSKDWFWFFTTSTSAPLTSKETEEECRLTFRNALSVLYDSTYINLQKKNYK